MYIELTVVKIQDIIVQIVVDFALVMHLIVLDILFHIVGLVLTVF